MDPITAITNALGTIIPALGIGSKARQAETAAMGKAQAEIEANQSKTITKVLVISGVLIFIILIIFLTLRKK